MEDSSSDKLEGQYQMVIDDRQHQMVIDDQQQQQQQQQQLTLFGNMMQPSSFCPAAENFMGEEDRAFDILDELDDAFLLFLNEDLSFVHEQRDNVANNSPIPNNFSSQPMINVELSSGGSSVASSSNTCSEWPIAVNMHLDNPRIEPAFRKDNEGGVKHEENRKYPMAFSSKNGGSKPPDLKTLKRLAQNREASRKSRQRKKAYVQELESSKMKLIQLEQELQAAKAQTISLGGEAVAKHDMPPSINSIIVRDATMFDVEHKRWQDDHHNRMCKLRAGMEERLPDKELKVLVDNFLGHYCMMLDRKSVFLKYDVFHFASGMWRTPAERGLLWMGGCRPSEIIKIVLSHIEPSSDQQIMAICKLQHSTEKAEVALSQGLDSLYQFLASTIASNTLVCPSDVANNPAQMVLAMNKLSTLEGFMRQADNLRQHSIRRIYQILTTRQAAKCFIGIFDHFQRLRAVSSLWQIGTENRNKQLDER